MADDLPPPPPTATDNMPSQGKSRDGKATAAGVLVVIQGALWLIGGLFLLSFRTSDLGSWADDIAGGVITFLTILVLLIGAACLWTGISLLRSKRWARITAIVIGGIDLLMTIPAFASADGIGSGLIGLIWSVAIIYLAAAGTVSE